MLTMESDRHHRSHPLLERSASSSLPTLPSVAELLASSRPASDTIPAYHQPTSPLRSTLSRATPPNTSFPSTSADTSTTSRRSSFVAVNHPNQASPTESIISTSPSEQQCYQQPVFQPSTASFTPAPMSEAGQSLQDTALSQAPINAGRQDSAISQRVEIPKDGQSFASSSELAFSPPDRNLNDRYQSTSPRLNPNLTAPSSPLPSLSQIPSYQPASQSSVHALRHGNANSYSAGIHIAADSSRSHEHVADLVHTSTGTESARKSIVPSLPTDQTNNTRQQRYNVRFAANHTPNNMPSSQRPRHDAPPTAPIATETSEARPSAREQPVTRIIEPAIQAITSSLQRSDEHVQIEAHPSNGVPAVERCRQCDNVWKRPLPDVQLYRQESPAGIATTNDSTTPSANTWSNMAAFLRQHGKEADELYTEWTMEHPRFCPPKNGEKYRGLSPHRTGSLEHSHSATKSGVSQKGAHVELTPNKRKSEVPHGDDQQKHQRLSLAAPPVRPPGPT